MVHEASIVRADRSRFAGRLGKQLLIKTKIFRASDMLDSNAKKIYQSADSATQIIRTALKHGQSLALTKDGNIGIKVAEEKKGTNAFVLWIRQLLGSSARTSADEERALKATLRTKIKIDVASASAHTSEELRKIFDDIESASKNGTLKDLCDQWITLKNQIKAVADDKIDGHFLQQEQQRHAQALADAAASDSLGRMPARNLSDAGSATANDGFNDANSEAESFEDDLEPDFGPKNERLIDLQSAEEGNESFSETASVPGSFDDGGSAPNIRQQDTRQTPDTSPSIGSAEFSASIHQNWLDEVNQALPPSVMFSGHADEIIEVKFTLPIDEYPKLFESLENTKLGYPPPPVSPDDGDDEESFDDSFDITTRVAQQTLIDCGRSAYELIEEDGFSLYFAFGANAEDTRQGIISFGRNSPGLTLETGSRLINQEALGTFDTPLKLRLNTRSGALLDAYNSPDEDPVVIDAEGGRRTPLSSDGIYRWKKLPDGSGEFEMLLREKINLLQSDTKQLPINRGSRWEGDLDENNFGRETRFKFRVSASDLEKGNLKNVTIVEPFTIRFRIQPAPLAQPS